MKRKGRGLILWLLFLMVGIVLVGCKKKEAATETKEEEKKSEIEEVMIEVPPVSSEGILYAVILEKKEKQLLVQTDEGRTRTLSIGKDTDMTELGEEPAEGLAIRAEYKGKLNAPTNGEIEIRKISSSDKLPKLSKEALTLVGRIIVTSYDRNMDALAELCDYPLLIDRGEKIKIGSKKEFLAQNKVDIFDKELVKQISETNPFMLTEYSQGFLLGKSNPNMIVSNTKKGWKISAFHYK